MADSLLKLPGDTVAIAASGCDGQRPTLGPSPRALITRIETKNMRSIVRPQVELLIAPKMSNNAQTYLKARVLVRY